jgi:hypothetical protein
MAAPLVTLGNATDFCRFVLGTSELALATTASCSVTAFSDKGPVDGWLLYASQVSAIGISRTDDIVFTMYYSWDTRMGT